jgi:hypothetical protein
MFLADEFYDSKSSLESFLWRLPISKINEWNKWGL